MRLRYTAVAVCAGNACVYAVVNTTPLVLGALMHGLDLDEAAAGALMSAALLTMGIAALVVAPLLVGGRKRRAALAAALVLTAGETAAALTDAGSWMTLWMLVIGVGAGALLAAVNAIIAATDTPDRLFGYALMSAYGVAALLVLGLSPAIGHAGHHGAFAVLAAFSFATLPWLRGLPQESSTWTPPAAGTTPRVRGGLALLAGIVIIGVPMMGFYAFIEVLGTRFALDARQIAQVFAAQQLASVAGALLAARAGLRVGLRLGILAATLLHTFAIALAVLGGGPFAFALGTILEGLSFLFLLPLLFTLAALLDPGGRWAAAANGALFVATGMAPALVGALLTARGHPAIAWLMLAATPIGLLAFAASLRVVGTRDAGAVQRDVA